MPRIHAAGYSDNTPRKQNDLKLVLEVLCNVCHHIFQKQKRPESDAVFHYLDLNAGPGSYPGTNVLGSPIIALDCAREAGVRFEAYCLERDPDLVVKLIYYLLTHRSLRVGETSARYTMLGDDSGAVRMHIYTESYTARVPLLLDQLKDRRGRPTAYGVIYSDETGSYPPFALLQQAAKAVWTIDVLIHAGYGLVKRQVYKQERGARVYLEEHVQALGKKFWLVREPYLQAQWSFLLGTNWKEMPRFSKQAFHDVNSPTGQSILRRLSRNHKERYDQGDLFSDA